MTFLSTSIRNTDFFFIKLYSYNYNMHNIHNYLMDNHFHILNDDLEHQNIDKIEIYFLLREKKER